MNDHNFSNLPEEFLLNVFSHLTQTRIKECQKVCRKWYRPAHIAYLKNIVFTNTSDPERFLNSIDHNPDPSYIKAVKHITFQTMFQKPLQDSVSKRLLSAFPNLEGIKTCGLELPFGELNQKFLETIPKTCPKFKSFTIQEGHMSERYNLFLYKMRNVLTKIKLSQFLQPKYIGKPTAIIQFLILFSRVQELDVTELEEFTGFAGLLQLLELLHDLKAIRYNLFQAVQADDKDYVKWHQTRKITRAVKEAMEKRYSALESLCLGSEQGLFHGVVNFIMKYFTGLKHFEMNTILDETYDEQGTQQDLEQFIKRITGIQTYKVSMQMGDERQFLRSIQHITAGTFTNAPADVHIEKRVLQLTMRDTPEDEHNFDYDYDHIDQQMENENENEKENEDIDIDINADLFAVSGDSDDEDENDYSTVQMESIQTSSNQLTRQLRILFHYSKDPANALDMILFNNLRSLDVFHFSVHHQKTSTKKPYFALLSSVLKHVGSLKKLCLQIPAKFTDGNFEPLKQFPQITHLQLKKSDKEDAAKTLLFCVYKFPSLKYLMLSGIWTASTPEYQVLLKNCALERLDLDLSPVKEAAERNSKGSNFLLIVDLLKSKKCLLYKGTFDGLIMTEINDTACDDYVKVHVTLLDLKSLNLRLCKKGVEEEFVMSPFDDTTKDTMQTKLLFTDQ